MFTPRDAVWLGIGSLVYPLARILTGLLGRRYLG